MHSINVNYRIDGTFWGEVSNITDNGETESIGGENPRILSELLAVFYMAVHYVPFKFQFQGLYQ